MKRIVASVLVFTLLISSLVFTAYAKEYDYFYIADSVYPESSHDYENNIFYTWDYTYSGEADGLFVTFSEDTYIDEGEHWADDEYGGYYDRDYLIVQLNSEGSHVEYFFGDDAAGKTLYIPSNNFQITLTSDAEGSAYGFSIDRISTEPPVNETVIRYHFTSADKVDYYNCFGNGTAKVDYFYNELKNGNKVFIGWSFEPNGDPEVYAYDRLGGIGVTHDLYAVWMGPIIARKDSFSFLNGDVGYGGPAEDNYYMTDEHYYMMLGNLFKNFGLGPIPGAIVAAVLATYPKWPHRGSCYGIATSVFLQHHGVVDFLEGTEYKSLSEMELDGDLTSRINYYQAQSASSFLCENLAPKPDTALYTEQLKRMYETVESGSPVLFSYYDYDSEYLISMGHTVVMVGAFVNNQGDKFLVACDSNDRYYDGETHYFRISSDFSEIYDCYGQPYRITGSQVGGFNWTADYEQFTSFDINGNGNPAVWYEVFFRQIANWFSMIFTVIYGLK